MRRTTVLTLCATLALASTAQGADEIYRWVDESGVVHFGDEPPPSAAADVRTLQLDIPPAAEGAAEEYSIHSQLERLYRTRPIPPERPVKPPPARDDGYPLPPNVIYQPLYGPYYGYPPSHRPGHLPAHPSWGPRPPHHPQPTPPPPRSPTGRLWLPK